MVYNLHFSRFGHPTDNTKGMFAWLNETTNLTNNPDHQFTKKYIQDNREMLVARYKKVYARAY